MILRKIEYGGTLMNKNVTGMSSDHVSVVGSHDCTVIREGNAYVSRCVGYGEDDTTIQSLANTVYLDFES